MTALADKHGPKIPLKNKPGKNMPGPATTHHGREPWPSDDEIVALMEEHGSVSAVARACGKGRSPLRNYLKIRPELDARVRALMIPPLTEAERVERRRANAKRFRERNREWKRERWRIWDRARRTRLRDAEGAREYERILRRDVCSYCGGPVQHIDHIVPRAVGGSEEWDNLTAACQPCNDSKSTRSLLEYLHAC